MRAKKIKLNDAVENLTQAMLAACKEKSKDVVAGNNRGDEEALWVEEILGRVRTNVMAGLERRAKADRLRPELREKITNWLISFHRLDPRYKILTFFNLVASDGADNFVNDEDENILTDDVMEYGQDRKSFTKAEQLLKDAFNTTSILTVWRPCSNDAMRKMMEGTGVGKGLDIKGKSAKKGKLSGYVPFLQIHQEDHKDKITRIGRKAKMRVYYSSREARDAVLEELEPLANDYMEFDPHKVIHSEMIELDKYAKKGYYGIEVYQRLFWEGYVVHQNIERTDSEDDGTVTGRPSMPGFQDANLKTLKVAAEAAQERPPPYPLAVVYQFNKEDPMDPKNLVIAYEENGTVTPVVSDFDGFLLGWRREALWFGCNIPREQEELMLWCVDRIEKILDEPPTPDTWTVRWLEVLKEENSPSPDIPEYGFGDPKSYGIMEQAAQQLIDTGAVRHGSECFNWYFPQEIDDTLLIISDTLKPVPWKYVNVKELQSILSQRIWEGFVFPINPKWILCDPGWKRLYDQLMSSDALYAEQNKDVWYPPHSGIREKIDRICAKHPKGFQRLVVPTKPKTKQKQENNKQYGYSPLRQNIDLGYSMSGNAAYDLAELELENVNDRRRRASRRSAAGLAGVKEKIGDISASSDDEEDDDNY